MADMDTLLWILMVAAYAVSIWMWASDFGRHFPRRSLCMRRVTAASAEVATEPPQWAA
jgi:hypothetical protein